MKILVVDDKASVRVLLDEYLTEQGFEIVTAVNGRQGLFAARHEQPDLILLDMRLPDGSGLDFLHEVRSRSAVPVIVMTAYGEVEDFGTDLCLYRI